MLAIIILYSLNPGHTSIIHPQSDIIIPARYLTQPKIQFPIKPRNQALPMQKKKGLSCLAIICA